MPLMVVVPPLTPERVRAALSLVPVTPAKAKTKSVAVFWLTTAVLVLRPDTLAFPELPLFVRVVIPVAFDKLTTDAFAP